jgi:hypothetical protein
MRKTILAVVLVVALAALAGGGAAAAKGGPGHGKGKKHPKPGTQSVSIFASGFNNPRGLTFGPDGKLYVAEGGLGGTHMSTLDACPEGQAHGGAAPYFGSTNDPMLGGRISKIDRHGHVSTVVDALPSTQTSPALGNLVSGVSSVAFVHHKLYALLAGAGCSHGVPTIPNGVIRVNKNGHWKLIANLSAFQAANPVAHPDDEDFEPDGTWYSMTSAGGALYPMDSNHGELDRVTVSGKISRVVDISAQLGHIVPTAILPLGQKGKHHGHGWSHHKNAQRFVISNLGVFGPDDGNTPNESVWTIDRTGHLTQKATGLEQVLGLALRGHALYALEMSTTPGGPTYGSGAIVQVGPSGPVKTVVSGLIFPTGMTVGRDGAFYVSEQGFGFGAGDGRILRITTS